MSRKDPDAIFGRLIFVYIGIWVFFRAVVWVAMGCRGPFIGRPDLAHLEREQERRKERDGPEKG